MLPDEMGNPHGKWSSKASKLETTIWAIRVLLICVGVGSCVTLLKATVIPYVSIFVIDTISCLCNSGRVLFSPPYIHVIVNCIIIAIAASTSFQHQNHLSRKPERTPPSLSSVRIGCISSGPPDNPSNTGATPGDRAMAEESGETCPESEGAKLPQTSSLEDEDRENTLDSIWTVITEGQGKQLAPQPKKSDTLGTSTRRALNEARPGDIGGKSFGKGETFRERTMAAEATVEGVVVKDNSMGQDELKLRIEAFIRMNHDYLRLQREESNLRFVEAVSNGTISHS